jgi:hypothetical protein
MPCNFHTPNSPPQHHTDMVAMETSELVTILILLMQALKLHVTKALSKEHNLCWCILSFFVRRWNNKMAAMWNVVTYCFLFYVPLKPDRDRIINVRMPARVLWNILLQVGNLDMARSRHATTVMWPWRIVGAGGGGGEICTVTLCIWILCDYLYVFMNWSS